MTHDEHAKSKSDLFNRGSAIVVLVSALFAGWLVWMGAVFLQFVLALPLLGLLPVMGIIAVLGGRVLKNRRERSPTERRVGRIMVLGCLFASTQVVGCAAGQFVLSHRVDVAKAWCESLALDLEQWNSEHGHYPESLDAVPFAQDRPKLCREDLLYKPQRDGFELDFFTGEWLAGWTYHSASKTWTYYN